MKASTSLAVFALLALFGCASQSPPLYTPPLVCVGDDQCKLYWERAQVWVAKNSRWKIQVATGVLIETYNSVDGSTSNHYTLLREPQASGVERITMTTGCDNIFMCEVRADVARRGLYQYVTGETVESPQP